MTELTYLDEVPGVDEFIKLRIAAGLTGNSPEAAEIGLANSCCSVTVREQRELVGMGRAIGDGGCFFQIVDIAVHPNHQRQGIGNNVMARLMKQLRDIAPRSAYVSLIADGPASHLYSKFGFEPVMPKSIGMAMRL